MALLAVLVGTRTALKLDQRELAKRMGWSQSKLSKAETGIRRVDLPEFKRLAAALGVDDIHLYTQWSRWNFKLSSAPVIETSIEARASRRKTGRQSRK